MACLTAEASVKMSLPFTSCSIGMTILAISLMLAIQYFAHSNEIDIQVYFLLL